MNSSEWSRVVESAIRTLRESNKDLPQEAVMEIHNTLLFRNESENMLHHLFEKGVLQDAIFWAMDVLQESQGFSDQERRIGRLLWNYVEERGLLVRAKQTCRKTPSTEA